jgi:hypothetical protein
MADEPLLIYKDITLTYSILPEHSSLPPRLYRLPHYSGPQEYTKPYKWTTVVLNNQIITLSE